MPQLIDIEWDDISEPSSICSYYTLDGKHPIGEILISWKECKVCHPYNVDIQGVGEIGDYNSLEEAKKAAQDKFHEIIMSCIIAD